MVNIEKIKKVHRETDYQLLFKSVWSSTMWMWWVLFLGFFADGLVYGAEKLLGHEDVILFNGKKIFIYCSIVLSAIFVDLRLFFKAINVDVLIFIFLGIFLTSGSVALDEVYECDKEILFAVSLQFLYWTVGIAIALKTYMKYEEEMFIKSLRKKNE